MSTAVPLYLSEPDLSGRTYGTLSFEEASSRYIVTAEPAVLEMAKRLFPGSQGGREGRIKFPATRRAVGDLNWLMLKYPLVVEQPARFAEDREKAIAHAQRRDANQVLGPVTPPPSFRGKLLPFQAEGVPFMVKNERVLLADDPGLGKTIQALAGLATAEAFPVLLVVPTNVQRQWRRQAGVFLDLPTDGQQALDLDEQARGERLCHIIKGRKPYQLPTMPIYIIHYGLLADWQEALLEIGFKAVVFDEIQELRHTGTAKYTAASLLAEQVTYVWGLSGTPIYNYGKEIWAITNILDYHCLGDSDSFSREWGTAYGGDVVAKPDVLGDYLRREGLMIRRRKSEVQSQLPPKRRVVHVVDKDEATYSKLIQEAVTLAHRYSKDMAWQEKGQTKRLIEGKARMAAGVAKAPFVATFVRTLLEAGERVLLYAYHHRVHDILRDDLISFNPVRISGEETAKEKDAAVEAFVSGKTDLVQLSLRSTAGLDRLQERGTCVVFAELDWSPAIHTQCEDRLQRMGIDEAVQSILCYYMVADTGMDETMQEALGLKVAQFNGLMGDQGQTEEDKALAAQAAERHMDRVIELLKNRVA